MPTSPCAGSHLKLGFNYKDKNRDYNATRFYYNLNKLNPVITDIYNTDGFLNQQNIADGQIVVQRVMQPKDSYRAGNEIYSAYLLTDFYPTEALLVNLGASNGCATPATAATGTPVGAI